MRIRLSDRHAGKAAEAPVVPGRGFSARREARSTSKIGLVPDRGADYPVGADKSAIHPFGAEGQGQIPISIHRDHTASTAEFSQRVDYRMAGLAQ